MIRWLRLASIAVVTLALIAAGVCVGLFVVENSDWVSVEVPPLLTGMLGDTPLEIWLPALLSSWLVTALSAVALVGGSLYYVWRRRQYESLIGRLEGELTELRNLPFTRPAPLEDLPESPDPAAREASRALGSGDAEGEDEGEPEPVERP